MLKSRIKIFYIFMLTLFSSSVFSVENPTETWGVEEHLLTGNKLQLYFCDHTSNTCRTDSPVVKNVPDVKIQLDNGLNLTLAEIITFSGDFFAVGDQPITGDLYDSLIYIEENRANQPPRVPSITELNILAPRFKQAFDSLATSWDADYKIALIYKYLNGELSLTEAIDLGLTRYDLAVKNYDHFSPYNWYAYLTGHYLAIDLASKAGITRDEQKLKYAYAIEGYAQHFLTDKFSAGHFRVPIKQIQKFTFFEKNALLLSKFMHDEDSKFGLNVKNSNGDIWTAYGDHSYSDPRNHENRDQLQNIQQLAIKQVFNAYVEHNNIDYPKLFTALQTFAPIVNNNDSQYDRPQNTPLFASTDDGDIYRRDDINKLQDKNMKELSPFSAITFLIKKLFSYDPS